MDSMVFAFALAMAMAAGVFLSIAVMFGIGFPKPKPEIEYFDQPGYESFSGYDIVVEREESRAFASVYRRDSDGRKDRVASRMIWRVKP